MKFVHIADMHFDSPFVNLSEKDILGDLRRLEQRKAFKKVIEYIKENNIKYFFISGDLYEHKYVRQSTIEYINQLFQEIPETQIFISPGNHDPKIKNSYYNKYNWNENVKIFGAKIEKIETEEANIYGYGFEDFYCTDCGIESFQIEDKSKLNILDTVKDIDTKVPITLSISISNEEKTYYERYKSALDGMELILGRGGDQAIIRKEGKYKFYGGTSLEVEKRTKVKARIVAHSIESMIQDAKDVIIMGHQNADIDSLGSSLGIYRLAKTIGKPAYIVNENFGMNLGKFVDTLLEEEEYKNVIIDSKQALNIISKETILIVVDTHKKSYVQVPELLSKTDNIVVIDHHRKSTDFIENVSLTFQEVYASSAAELVTEIIQYVDRKVELSQIEIESLYGGIMVDTKNFTFKTGVRTFEAAAYLRKFGVDIIKVKKWFQADLESYNVIADIVKSAEIIENSIAIAINDAVGKDANTICAKAADELLTISDITASFVIGDTGENICISGRSIGDINVQVILEKLGGGGHITLAGAQLENMTLEEAKSELINRINEYFSEINM